MKKKNLFLSFFCLLAAMLFCVACGSDDDDNNGNNNDKYPIHNVYGKWQVVSYANAENDVYKSWPYSNGSTYFTFKEDGSFTTTGYYSDFSSTFTFDTNNKVISVNVGDGDAMVFNILDYTTASLNVRLYTTGGDLKPIWLKCSKVM